MAAKAQNRRDYMALESPRDTGAPLRDMPCEVERERERLAAELQDRLRPWLESARVDVETALYVLERGHLREARRALMKVASLIGRAVDEVGGIAMGLRPATLDDLGILATLAWYLREFRASYRFIQVDTRFAVEERDIPARLKLAVFRVVQQTMDDVGKCSRPAHASLLLERRGDKLFLEIGDDGAGLAAEALPAGIAGARPATSGPGVRIAIAWDLAA